VSDTDLRDSLLTLLRHPLRSTGNTGQFKTAKHKYHYSLDSDADYVDAMASNEGVLNPDLMHGIDMLNNPSGVTTPGLPPTWEDIAAELSSFRTRFAKLEEHADWVTDEYNKAIDVNQRLNDKVEALTKKVDDQAVIIEHLGHSKPSSSGIKAADPPLFEGNPRELDAWILACRLRFSLQPSKFVTEDTKVQYAISFLKGPPKLWINPLASKFLIDRTGVPEFEAFETFVASIRSLYGDPNLARNATNQLKIIKQTTSVSEYYSRFIGYSQHTAHNDIGLRDFFYDGLKETIKDELAKMPLCLTLESLKAAATQLDSRMQERRWEREHLPRKNPEPSPATGTRLAYTKPPATYNQTQAPAPPRTHQAPAPRPQPSPAAPSRPTPSPAAPADGTTPMELDSQRMLRPLTQAEREQCIKEGRCLRCRRPGHTWRECSGRFAMAAVEMTLSENDESQE
jgi:Retrotransposon gag protein